VPDLKKPVTFVVRGCRVTHKVSPDLELTLRPGGLLSVRELRRKDVVDLDLGALYCGALLQEARSKIKRNGK
jgi:hypothetical protein